MQFVVVVLVVVLVVLVVVVVGGVTTDGVVGDSYIGDVLRLALEGSLLDNHRPTRGKDGGAFDDDGATHGEGWGGVGNGSVAHTCELVGCHLGSDDVRPSTRNLPGLLHGE